jgi:glycosyltransferase involved in cell wall biosynthesis
MPRLVQISFSAIPDDPRVRRHGDALQALGWDVVGLGLAGGRGSLPGWPVATVGLPEPEGAANVTSELDGLKPQKPLWKTLARGLWFCAAAPLGALAWLIGAMLGFFRQGKAGAFLSLANIIWTDIGWPIRVVRRLAQKPIETLGHAIAALEVRRPVAAMIEAGESLGPADIWVANDWTALPVAVALRDRFGGQVVYDSHEFALEEYAQDWAWRLFERPIAAKIEGDLIQEARVVTAVSQGIVSALRDAYHVNAAHEVVINAPPYIEQALRPTKRPIQFLYHGIVAPGRGLEILIKAASLWQGGHVLSIRGPGQSDYLKTLEDLIAALGVSDHVKLLEPVAMTDLVEAALAFDVGLMALPGHSAHNRFALPNKVFEYMAAGLALCVSDLPEMAHVVAQTGCGTLLPTDKPADIAHHFDAMTVDQVDQHKRASLEAAKTYNGGASAATLNRLYRDVLAQGGV